METQLSRDQVIDYLSRLPVMELTELMHELEVKWGVSATPNIISDQLSTPTGHIDGTEQIEFEVQLTHVDPSRKIDTIKLVREITGLGLKPAKDLVEEAGPESPKSLKTGVSKADAEELKLKMATIGAVATLV